MIGIVIVAHGGLAKEYLAAMKHVVGELPDAVAVSIRPEDDLASKEAEINEVVKSVESGGGVVVVTDIFGGTPSNLAAASCKEGQRVMLYGANVPMLIQLAKVRHAPLRVAVASALTAGRKYINSFDGADREKRPIAL